jgi:hypothetical protein
MNNPQTIFLSIAISIGVFLLLREVFCWYFKINKRLSVLEDIRAELFRANGYSNTSRGADSLSKASSGLVGPSGKAASAYVDKPKESFWRAK